MESRDVGANRALGAVAVVEQVTRAITRSRRVAAFAAALTHLTLIPELAVAAAVLAALVLKIDLMQPAASGSIRFAVVQHDAEIFAIGSLLYAAAILLQRLPVIATLKRLASITAECCFGLFFLLVVFYLADVLVYRFFVTRLYASDLVTFSGEMHAGLTLSRSGLKSVLHHDLWKLTSLAAVVALFIRGFFILFVREAEAPGKRSAIGAASALFWMLVWLAPVPSLFYSFDDKPLYENVIERNRNYFVQSNFSNDFRAKVLATPEPLACSPVASHRVNVVLLLVESLSAYQSNYFSGIENWTPQLDDIARHETALTNFHANGWTTIGGLVSLMTGTVPLVPEHTTFNRWGSPRLPDFAGHTPSLPLEMEKLGYNTEFIGAGDLDFTGQDTWLHQIGFQKLVGGTDPRFDGQKIRGPFNSVPDRLLYNVALDELHAMPTEKPYFAVVQTFWTHRPFVDENGKQLDGEELVFREADAQIGNFYRRLMEEHFFDNGLLVIVGDHRAPLPFRKAEFIRFGASAIARIPAVVVTKAFPLPHVIAQDFQQRDFMASVVGTVSGQSCLRPEQGNFLSSPPRPPACIIHARGDDRDLVLVTCGSSEAVVRVAGDRTRFVEGSAPDEDSVLQAINRTRARP